MHRARRRFLIPLLLVPALTLWYTACSEAGPSAPLEDPDIGARFDIYDGANGGTEGFYFLPPLVADPGTTGAGFNGAQSPVVRICDPAGCGVSQLAEFTMTTGPGSETMRVVPADEHYIVNWHTDQFAVSSGETYRVNVFAFGELLGFADVQLAASGKEARNVTTGELIGLVGGRTLPIKFRIEEGAAAEEFPIMAAEGGMIESADGSVTVDIPPAALTVDQEITVEPVDATGDVQSAVVFGPDGLQFDEPILVTLTYNVAALPPGVAEEDLALNSFEDGEWIVVPGSTVGAGTVTAPIHHFSKYGVGPANRAVFCSGDTNASTFESIADAIAAVVTGGTVAVCDGTHSVENVIVNKPVTIEAKGGANPVLQTATQSQAFRLDGYSTGTVIIDGLNFEITTPNLGPDGLTTYSIKGGAAGTYAGLTVRNSTFTVGPLARGAIAVLTSTVTPTVEVENVTIDGGVFGIAAIDVVLNVTNSQFTGGRNRRVQYSTSSGRIEGSSFSDCGTAWCVHVLNTSDVEIVNNTFAPHTLTGNVGPDLNDPIFVRLGSTALISGNNFQGCGYFACLDVEGATATITGNTFTHVAGSLAFQFVGNIQGRSGANVTIDGNQHTSCGYTCYKILDGTTAVIRNETANVSQGHGTSPVLVGARDFATSPNNVITFEDNVVVGTAPLDPTDAGTYPATEGIAVRWSDATAARNTFSNVASGVHVGTDGSLTGNDNVFDRMVTAFSVFDNGFADFSFNDFTNQVHDIEDYNGTSNLRCNWWGNLAGPQSILTVIPATVYTPFATAPIAGTSHAGCTL